MKNLQHQVQVVDGFDKHLDGILLALLPLVAVDVSDRRLKHSILDVFLDTCLLEDKLEVVDHLLEEELQLSQLAELLLSLYVDVGSLEQG